MTLCRFKVVVWHYVLPVSNDLEVFLLVARQPHDDIKTPGD